MSDEAKHEKQSATLDAVTSTDWLSALTKNVTRITVVNHSTPHGDHEKRGRVFEKWDIQIELSVQDGGRTLKVFIDDRAE
jgi:hypothetical protein